ncbi:hypothetical protein ACFFU9_01270 [Mariniflexile ostreae]|uniref:Uncharacterized protein n=1 Tax=Mariniflexile ostreae TaxID=1520892 RepID=A0ABV5F8A9_9FLAO
MISKQDEPFLILIDKLKRTVSSMELRDGRKPTFEDYIDEMLNNGGISINNLQEQMRAHALAWSGAGLGKSDWKNLYKMMTVETVSTKLNDFINDNRPLKKYEKSPIKSKTLEFFGSLGLEIDEEIIKVIKNVGIIKIILAVAGFFILRFLVSHFGSEDDFITFYLYLGIGLILFLSWYMSELKDTSKILSVLKYGALILTTVVALVFILALMYGVLDLILDVIKYIYNLCF